MVNIVSGGVVLAFCLMVATPLCGWLFACGCDWPWSGLAGGCNITIPGSGPHCPWCVSLAAGIAALGLATLGGTWAAMFPVESPAARHRTAAIALWILTGVTVFILLAGLGAAATAAWQDYPLGIGSYVNGF